MLSVLAKECGPLSGLLGASIRVFLLLLVALVVLVRDVLAAIGTLLEIHSVESFEVLLPDSWDLSQVQQGRGPVEDGTGKL